MQDILVNAAGAFVLRAVTGEDVGLKEFDFQIGASTTQHQKHLLIAQKGEYKAAPEIGVGITDELNGEDPKALLIKAKRNFEYDGMRIARLAYGADGKIYIDAAYE
ncbi:MAG: oxidase [Flavobacteriales bacterium]